MEKVKEKFLLQCKKCNSFEIAIITFGYGGEILIYCQSCENEEVF
jgi:hypothetical protein